MADHTRFMYLPAGDAPDYFKSAVAGHSIEPGRKVFLPWQFFSFQPYTGKYVLQYFLRQYARFCSPHSDFVNAVLVAVV